jgi:integrase
MAPEFVQILEPLERKSGYVFTPILDGRPIRDSLVASKTISAMGRKAGIIVDAERGKYATAHDLRRAFGFRWSRTGITIAELKELMRHSDIKTTLTFYVGQDARSTAARLWEVCGKLCGTDEGLIQKPLENKYTPQESNL